MYSFLKDQGYIYDSSLSGHVVYAHKGKKLKNKLEQYIRYLQQREDIMEIESPLIYSKKVWEQSGHWTKFQDPVVRTKNDKCYRLDKLIEKYTNTKYEMITNWEQVQSILSKINAKESTFSKDPIIIKDEVEWKSLMMKTMSSHNEVGLRPETATATYQNFEDLYISNGKQFPIKVFQVGKSFRNEIATRHNLIRGREFTQLETQIILPSEMKTVNILEHMEINMKQNIQLYDNKSNIELITWQDLQDRFALDITYFELLYLAYQILINLCIKPLSIRLRRHLDNEKAFYALDAWDIEVNLKDIGWTEIGGVHDRGKYDLNKILGKKWHKKGIPHILEMAIGIDRLLYCILDNLFEDKNVQEGKSMLKIPYFLAPVQICVLPLIKNKVELCTMNDVLPALKDWVS
jgi:glycyl-tRNA synthetase